MSLGMLESDRSNGLGSTAQDLGRIALDSELTIGRNWVRKEAGKGAGCFDKIPPPRLRTARSRSVKAVSTRRCLVGLGHEQTLSGEDMFCRRPEQVFCSHLAA